MRCCNNFSTSSPKNLRVEASTLLAEVRELAAVTTQSKKGSSSIVPLTISTLGKPAK
ncbi:hypothetical protein MEN41_00450 [Dolichospermum sp. ST_con]|nr:hypothetical protein [Dolichospermum sp. ST_con]MDD1421974.1 hypothetical protein [Dolichospermum sp. ST_sed1]MDD1427679.1 hypothetical protein [Dolichospermum sp. ST_sed9]MDD1434169.1 hypothetical protein [Dolichospermum sp. ST_sed6]MDD1437619.1 hypothetical protein [Dolichospermum sp. ST_sed10]MDD1443378.1 hypothetical protein [Dolichospermum sp. ST_sed3]MDD1449157.1 hypothetical protein [Dolichospermum sp. ST_sed8]MDD1457819.1 hypothetical protein [Dolichospermum sp. ST_sed7]MDD146305